MDFTFLNHLSVEDKLALERKLEEQLAVHRNSKKEIQFTVFEEFVWNQLSLLTNYHRSSERRNEAIAKYGVRKLRTRIAEIDNFAVHCFPVIVRRPVKEAFLVVVLKCLVDDLTIRFREREDFPGVPVTPFLVLDHIDKLEFAVDKRFPGYLKAGLLHKIAPLVA